MEDLQSLMSCLDEISNVIGDGMYLSMADKLKRIHNKLNGDKPFHEDSFYYSDEDETSNSDDDSDSIDDEAVTFTIQLIRDHLLGYVRSMHQVWAEVQKWEKEVKKVIPLIKRMSPVRKAEAIHAFCRKCYTTGKVEDDAALVGNISGYTFRGAWTWERLVDNGLRAIVMEIGTEEEIEKAKRKNMHCDDLSLATLKKLPAFEKKIYDDYKRWYNEEVVENRREANAKVREHEESMQRWEMRAREEENKLRELGARVYDRDRWDAEAHDFWVDDVTGRLVNGP
tara:strand:- start:11522 stop:12370 length:849 start_codon:yes stop_codon:yes gene_type:complete